MLEQVVLDYMESHYRKRKLWNTGACCLLGLAAAIVLFTLFSVFVYILKKGFPALDFAFFTELPKPVGEVGGGMANALVGTSILVALASGLGIPWGIATGLYLSEYGRGWLACSVRFSADILASIPSIVIGLFVYAILVMPMKRFSALAGGIALGILMIPTIARSTEELLKLVPTHIREAGLALGLPRWKVILWIVLNGSRKSISTAVILALARVAGETAPLLFTAFGNHFWHHGLDQPIASLPVQIYTYSIAPYENWHRQAWAGALVLVLFVFTLNLTIRIVLRNPSESKG